MLSHPSDQPPVTHTAAGEHDDLALFWELAAELFCVLAPDGRFLRVNPAWTHVLGWPEEELIGKAAFDFVHPDDLAATRHVAETDNAEGQRMEEFQNRYRHKDGSYRWLSWTGYRRGDRWFGTARDITTMRMSHGALQRSERRSRALLAALREGLVVMDGQGRITEINEAFAEMVGMQQREILGLRPPYPWWPPEELATITDALSASLASDTSSHELTFVRSDGRRFPVLIDTTDIAEAGGKHTMVSVIRDVSELVRTRDRLAEAQRVAGLVTWEYDADRDEIVAHGSARAAAPHDRITMTLEDALGLVPEPVRSTFRQLTAETLAGEREGFLLEARVQGVDVPEWIEVRGEQLRAPDGRIVGMRGTTQRIDARKRAEFEAHLQRDILDAIDVAVIARGPDMRLAFANDAAVRLLRWPREELEGTGPEDVKLVAPGQPETDALIAALKEGVPWDGELMLRRRDGSEIGVRVRTAAVRDPTGAAQYVAGIIIPLGGG